MKFPKIAHPKKRAFLRAYSRTASKTRAARLAQISRRTQQLWQRNDPAFAAALADAKEMAAEHLEAEANRRAVQGQKNLVTYRGEVVFVHKDANGSIVPKDDPRAVSFEPLYRHAYSDSLMTTLLKANMPDKYGKHVKVEQRESAAPRRELSLEQRRQEILRIAENIRQRIGNDQRVGGDEVSSIMAVDN